MPREKKSRGSKALRSEEDRPLYLQQRAQAEAELAHKKEEILTHFLRDKLQEEERNSALNLQKLNDGWRSILRQSKSSELKKNIEVLKQIFERQIDGLDSIIKHMEVSVVEAESQSAQLHRSHHMYLKRLSHQQEKRMAYLEQYWESTIEKIVDMHRSEREQRLAETQLQHQDVEDNSYLLQQKYNEMMSEIAAEYRQSMDFYENQFLDKKNKLMRIPEERRREHQQLMQEHNEKRQELESLIKENQDYIQSINQNNTELQSLQKKLLDLQMSLSSGENGQSEIEEQVTASTEAIKSVRAKMEHGRTQARKRLTVLTVHSDGAAKKLQTVINQGERILRLAKLCKKLENKLLITEELEQTPSGISQEEKDDEAESCEFPEQRFFANRHTSALLLREALRRRRDTMRRENVQLHFKIQQLRQHQDAMTVSGRSMPRPDKKKGRSTAPEHKPSQGPPPGCALSLTGTQAPIVAGQKRMHH